MAAKSTIRVASLNMNGFGTLYRDDPQNKWGGIYRMMNEERIGLLLLQETHLTVERRQTIEKMFSKKIKVFHSSHPDQPTQRDGVAIVVNKRLVPVQGAEATVIVPGRAIQLSVKWNGGDDLRVLCIYAPADGASDRRAFFTAVQSYYTAHPELPHPHLMAGDFNNVEDMIDRLPMGEGPDASIELLDALKIHLGLRLVDGWRAINPDSRGYTFHRGSGPTATLSRLDRIYANHETIQTARNWKIHEGGVRSDHSIVSVEVTCASMPDMGRGRPTFPAFLLKDKQLAKDMKAAGMRAIQDLHDIEIRGRSETVNAQTVLARLKAEWMRMARQRERETVPKLLAEIQNLEKELRSVQRDRHRSEESRAEDAAALTAQIKRLREERFRQLKAAGRAKHRIEGERPTRYWTRLHRDAKPRDVMYALQREGERSTGGGPVYEKDSAKMAELARRHHMNLQRDDADVRDPDAREKDIQTALQSLEAKVSDEQAEEMGKPFSYQECVIALRFSKNGTAPGLDGLTYEVWKTLHDRFIEDSRHQNRAAFDAVRILSAAFDDVQKYGVTPGTRFTDGWMCPIYKEKGELTKIVNYRPITLLNTDYKLLTKMLAIRLADVADDIIHPAQAGFVPGRRLHNHTQLARLMMDWAERTETNGAIVALDQEKAYDKISHDYLWRVLEAFGIPPTFIRVVQSLYAQAETSVMINGILSNPYRVYRGVRQGDPMSCLLFDLAIEPLSAMIRKSQLEGFKIPGSLEALKATLFADDTTVYLAEDDDFAVLQGLLDTWCSAAKARFNIKKTEVIPIGERAYREEMADHYNSTGSWKNYPTGIHMAGEGVAVRILGAFLGNGVDECAVWSPTLAKVSAVIERWQRGISTVEGRRHVVQMMFGGMTQFLTDVQRMPDPVQSRLNRMIRQYLWHDRHTPLVKMDYAYVSREDGGLGILDLKSRNEAIDIMWLHAYLDFSPKRPLWAYVADDIFRRTVPKDCTAKLQSVRINPFLQDWRPKTSVLPAALKAMVKTAEKYRLRLEAIAPSRDTVRAMPMWYHPYAQKPAIRKLAATSEATKCLRDRHLLRTVSDFENLVVLLSSPDHVRSKRCVCDACTTMRAELECADPQACCERAQKFLDTLPPKWSPAGEKPEDFETNLQRATEREMNRLPEGVVAFDRRVTTYGNVGNVFRVFTDGDVCNNLPDMSIDEIANRLCVMATDGSCLRNGQADAQAGAGVYIADNHPANLSLRLPSSISQSNQTGEAVATLMATKSADDTTPPIQETDSKTVLDCLTKYRARHEDDGYVFEANSKLTKAIVASLRARKARTYFLWVKGHNGHPRNEGADRLAGLGAQKADEDDVPLDVQPELRVTGCRLAKMTQKLAYRAIRTRVEGRLKERPRTVHTLRAILRDIKASFGVALEPETVWKALKRKEIPREPRQYLWLAIHDGYRVGDHWLRDGMPDDLRARGICEKCEETESMEHILFDCRTVGRGTVWELLESTWELTETPFPGLNVGTVLGAGCAQFLTAEGERRPLLEALWTTLVVESAYLVWKLRCERVLQRDGEDFSVRAVTNRWYAAMNQRLTLDRRSAAKYLGKSALKACKVAGTWFPVLDNKIDLPANWVTDYGVLVGIKRRE